jgi:hypothetical protein
MLPSSTDSLHLLQKFHPKFPPVANFCLNFQVNFSLSEWIQACGVEVVLVQDCSRVEQVALSAPHAHVTLAHVQGPFESAKTAMFAPGDVGG